MGYPSPLSCNLEVFTQQKTSNKTLAAPNSIPAKPLLLAHHALVFRQAGQFILGLALDDESF